MLVEVANTSNEKSSKEDAPIHRLRRGHEISEYSVTGNYRVTVLTTSNTRYKYGGEHRKRMGLSNTGDAAEADERNDLFELASSVLIAVRSSFLAFVVALGVVMLVASLLVSGHVLPGFSYGIIAAMLFVWGISAFVYAFACHVGLKLIGYH